MKSTGPTPLLEICPKDDDHWLAIYPAGKFASSKGTSGKINSNFWMINL